MIERHSLKEESKYYNELSKYRQKCKCGHSVFIVNKKNKVLCTWCHNYVYKTKLDEFKDRMRGVLNG